MELADAVTVGFLAVLIGWIGLVLWGQKHAIDRDLEAERRQNG